MIPVCQNARQREPHTVGRSSNPECRKQQIGNRIRYDQSQSTHLARSNIVAAEAHSSTYKMPNSETRIHKKVAPCGATFKEAREEGIMEGNVMCRSGKRNGEEGRESVERRGLKSNTASLCALRPAFPEPKLHFRILLVWQK